MAQIHEQLLQSFSDAMPFGVCFVDSSGKIIYWNPASEALTGYMSHEALGRMYRDDLLLQCSENGASLEALCPVIEVQRDGRPVDAEMYLRHKDGHRIPVHVFAFPLRDEAGEIRGVGEIFDAQWRQDSAGRGGHSDREFEIATGLPGAEESREHLKMLLRSALAPSAVLILMEMAEQCSMLHHGGTAMLHQSLRVLAKTVAGLLPARSYVGCWCEGKLTAIVPECAPETLEQLKSTLASVGSSCAVKWWGDRVAFGVRAAACYVDPSLSVDALIQRLELDLKSAGSGKEQGCSSSLASS